MSGKSLSFAQVSDWSSGLEEIQMAASSESLKIKKHLSPSFFTQTAFLISDVHHQMGLLCKNSVFCLVDLFLKIMSFIL